jgi:RNA polymerase sigma-70 factor (ECF subfamily)
VFEYSYGEIASTLDLTQANCRQLFHRAKARLASGRARAGRSFDDKRRLAEQFASAMRAGDREELTRVLAEDVGFWGDGGGRVIAAKRPILGRESVINFIVGIRRTAAAAGIDLGTVSMDIVEVNYDAAMVVRVGGRLDSVYVCSTEGDAISGIRVVRNPDKLAYIARQLGAPLLAGN